MAADFHFDVREGQSVADLSLEEAVFQALGAASVCWETPEGAGVFDSSRCRAIGDRLVTHVIAAKTGKSVSDRVAALRIRYETLLHQQMKSMVRQEEEINTLRARVAHYEGANTDGN